jgi:tellurite resistance protein
MKQDDRKTLPVGFFGIAVGTLALSNAWRVGVRLWHLDMALAHAMTAASLAVWLLLLVAYGMKWIRQPEAALKELNDPHQSYFVALVPVSSLLAASALIPFARPLAVAIFAVAVAFQLGWGVVAHGRFWQGTEKPASKTPAMYLSAIAPNLVSATTAAALGWPHLGMLFFGAGVVYWLLIEALILGGVANNRALDKALRPAIGIQLAPPVVAGVAWLSFYSGGSDVVAYLLLGYGLYQVLLLLRLLPWILEQPFSPSYWAFSFGVAALPTMVMRMAGQGESGFIVWLAPALFIVSNGVIALLVVKTVGLLLQGRLLPAAASLPRGTVR